MGKRMRWGALPVTVVLAGLALAGCRESGDDGTAFELAGKIFVFNYRVATARYLVNIRALRPVRGERTAVAQFDDPAGGPPITVREKIWPDADKTTIQSPPLRCVAKDRPYRVVIDIEGGDGAKLQTIETTVTSSENQWDVLPDRPLVVGPLYTPNPELAGNPGGKLPDPGAPPCPGA